MLLGSIPSLWALGDPRRSGSCWWSSSSIGIFTVFFDVAYQSYLPSLVDREQLIDGNSKLQMTVAVAAVAGPGSPAA